MKVTTDACILGASFPVNLKGNVLDIGTGTGLLALMIAQRNECKIDAVELDEESFNQAKENVSASKWSNIINVIHSNIREFESVKKYDFVICNPPFFEKHLKSSHHKKNKARHADELSIAELLTAVQRLLSDGGIFSVLLPESSSPKLLDLAAEKKLFPFKKIIIRDSIASKAISTIHHFSFHNSIAAINKKSYDEVTLLIKDEASNYTSDFIELLRDFYLHF